MNELLPLASTGKTMTSHQPGTRSRPLNLDTAEQASRGTREKQKNVKDTRYSICCNMGSHPPSIRRKLEIRISDSGERSRALAWRDELQETSPPAGFLCSRHFPRSLPPRTCTRSTDSLTFPMRTRAQRGGEDLPKVM